VRALLGKMMKIKYVLIVSFTFLFCSIFTNAQNYKVSQTGVFTPQNKKVLLLKDSKDQKDIILFQTNLRVNTDGSPLSYHPNDPRGKEKALNNICNAIVVKKENLDKNLCFTNFNEAIGVFEKFRDSNYQTIPSGYKITWHNVLPTIEENGKDIPCVFKSGNYKGYFGSLTALKNNLTGDKGECEINNQVDPLKVPALVLVGGQNVVKDFGAKVGDLVFAYNPETKLFTSAIIGDTGPKDNLGEGSILLNMKLLGTTIPPKNRAETFKINIENTQVLIAIIPSLRLFKIKKNKPYTAKNIEQRIKDWQKNAGFATPEKFLEFIRSFKSKLD
jgi:hypothetical protein